MGFARDFSDGTQTDGTLYYQSLFGSTSTSYKFATFFTDSSSQSFIDFGGYYTTATHMTYTTANWITV